MRNIPPALLAHLQQPVTTTCRLLRFDLKNGDSYGLATLDRDVIYQGVTYSAARGFDPSVIASDTGLSVDNAEGRALLGEIDGITLEMVAAGEMSDASWTMLLVNWRDLGMGHMIIDAGDVGEVNVSDDQVYIPELVSIAMRLRQPIGHFWSRTCRAVFGSPPNSQTGCGVNVDALWIAGAVTGVSTEEPTRVFADSTIAIDPVPNRARVQWLTGPNAGERLYQVEAYSPVSGTLALIEPVPFPIADGHQFRFRADCDKSPAQCTAYGNWINYKGENLIPVGEGVGVLSPKASIAGGFQGAQVIE